MGWEEENIFKEVDTWIFYGELKIKFGKYTMFKQT
jgi:hypothetical protein